jgi:hypothetical protein
MANNPNLPKFTSEQAREAGKKSKRGRSLKTLLREVCENGEIDEKKFIKSLYLNAMKGNSGIAKLIMEYREGKVVDKVEHSGPDGDPINSKIQIEFVDAVSKKD